MGSIDIQVRGLPEVHKALSHFTKPDSERMLQKAVTAGARAAKPFIKAAAPKGATGNLRRKVSARKAKRDRPAALVKSRAFYNHMVIGGTRAHGPRRAAAIVFEGRAGLVITKRVAGTPPRPFVDEGYRAGEQAILRAIDKVIEDALAGVG